MPVNFNVTPAISGQSTFDIEAGALTIPAGQEYTITNQSSSSVTVTLKIWGAGSGGEGGYTTGNLVIAAGASVKAHAGNPGASNHGGGGGSGVYSSTDINVAYGVAGGSGGAGNTTPGVGGGTTGGTGTKVGGWEAYGGGGGTQSAAGGGGGGDRGSGGAGSGRNGGAGSGNSTTYAGGTGYGNGGQGTFRSGDGIAGGGGGGYFGGGGGGASAAGAAGGGGSGYSGGLTDGTTIQGVGTDSDRGSAGSVGTAGKIMFIYNAPPPNTLATRFFPDVYFTLIEGFTGTKKYIDGANGSNSNNGDTVSSAYATIDYALTANTSATATMFIILEGTYTMTAVSTGNSVAIRDGGNARVFVCCPGRTIIQWTASTGDRDSPLVSITNANSAIYGGIFKRNNNGRTTNYTVAFWKAQTRGNYYNSVFSETNGNNAWSYQYDNYGQNNLAVRNCTFFNDAAPSGNYTNAGTCLTIDTVFNTTVTTGGTETNVLKSQSVDPTTYVTSGVTTAGVYSGTYSWSSTRTLPPSEPEPTPGIPVEAFLWGGGGGGGTAGGWSFGAAGGAGGAAEGVLTALLNQALYITVGGGGQVNSTTSATGGGGIANRSGSDNRYGSGGGGFSGIFTTVNPSLNGSVIIAGGGGGGGSSRAGTGNAGGAGGGTVGEDGVSPYDSKTAYRGRGGTQSAAGADASCDSANASGFQGALQGGTSRINGYGGAGGGGYYGGSAGGYSETNTMAGGGGGSGYFNPSLVTGGVLYSGTGTTPGNNSGTYRGTAGNAGAVATAGSAGKVVIRYPSAVATASGGTITTEGSYTVHTFTANDTFTLLTITPGLIAPSTVNRGQSFEVILITEDVADNTTVAYTITGATSGDLDGDPLSGNFTVVNNISSITIQTADIPLNRTLTISANDSTAQVQLLGSRKISATYLLAAGGGGGGTDMGGGGGAGGVLTSTVDLSGGNYPVVIGGGGLGNKGVGYNSTPAPGASGTNSTFNGLTALGGAGGRSGHWVPNYNGSVPPTGGSGGGGSPGGTSSNAGSSGTPGQGTNGGIGLYISNYFAGAGGGAGGNDEVNGVSNTRPGIGGPGLQSSISGTSLRYGGGGGGAGHTGAGAGTGGLGGGGGGARYDTGVAAAAGGTGGVNPGEAGGRAASAAGGAAGANTASGGGGGSHSTGHGGNGGSGIFIIRYAGAPAATGGTITAVGDDTVHTFTASGTFALDLPAYQPGLNVNKTTAYNGDTVEFVYVDQTAADNTTIAYTITGVTTSDINGSALTGNFTIVGGIAYLTLTLTNVTSKTLTLSAAAGSTNVSVLYAVTMRYLTVAGGGGGGSDMGGGGGAGGYLAGTGLKVSNGSYSVVVGAGGNGAPPGIGQVRGTNGTDSQAFNFNALGGGGGASAHDRSTSPAGNGGSGGGASGGGTLPSGGQGGGGYGGGIRGLGTPGQGNDGGTGVYAWYPGGGGGAGSAGTNTPGNGGIGVQNDILGTSYFWAGGGGGSGYSGDAGNGGSGGGGGGAPKVNSGGNAGTGGLNAGVNGEVGSLNSQTNKKGGAGGINTGSGGGGGSHYSATNDGGNGGSGIVVVRYSGGQKAVGGTVTTVSTDTVHSFITSGTLTVFPGEGLTPSTTAAYFGDTFTVYLTANETNGTTVPYTITGVTSAEINNASLTGNFTISNGIASLQVVTVTGTQDTKTFSITAYGYTATVTLTYLVSMTAPSIAGWGAPIVITIRTENLATGATVPYTISGVTTSNLLGASLTGNITIAAGTDPKTSTLTINTDPTLLTTQTITVTLPGNFSTSTLVTFISVPRNITLITSAAGTPAVVSTTLSDLKESLSVANQWDYSQVIPTFFTPQGGPLKISPTDPGDLVEQVSVATSPQGHGSEQVLEQVNMVGTRSSPTYVYSDGAPVAAPAPGEQLIQIWYIT